MAEFSIPCGDTTPVLEISLKVANSDPETYWNGPAHKADGVSARGIHHVTFTMSNVDTGEVVIAKGVSSFTQVGDRTILRYAWIGAASGYPETEGAYAGDTGIVGTYEGEFEVTFNDSSTPPLPGRRRTFPATPGDSLLIIVTSDLDDDLA